MRYYIKILIILLLEVFIFSLLINYEFYKKIFNIREKEVFKIIEKITRVILITILIILLSISIKSYLELKKYEKENQLRFQETDLKIEEEYAYYNQKKKEITNRNIEPYILEGFTYLEGNYDNGFVIEDKNGNQYVWVPCCTEINELRKSNYSFNPFIPYSDCYDEEYKEFLNSAMQNGGFYISRFEIGNENGIPVSKFNAKIWNNINLEEAKKIANSMYNELKFNCELINGFAYDTTLNWILDHQNIVLEEQDKKNYTGRNAYQNIYDIIDNDAELTLEKSYSNMVIYRNFFTTSSQIQEEAGIENLDNRFCIEPDKKSENIGMRTILYKK